MSVIKRWFLLIPIVLLLLFTGVWAARTQLAEQGLSSAMRDQGLSDISVSIDQIDVDKSDIAKLAFTLKTETEKISVDVTNACIRYQPRKLKAGKIDTLVIDKLVVSLEFYNSEYLTVTEKHPPAENNTVRPRTIIKTVSRLLHDYVVFDSLLVKEVVLDGEPFAVLNGKTFRLDSDGSQQSLTTSVILLDPLPKESAKRLPKLTIDRLTGSHVGVLLNHVDVDAIEKHFNKKTPAMNAAANTAIKQGNVTAKLELDLDKTILSGDYLINTSRLRQWLQPFVVMDSLDGIGNLDGNLSFDFTADEQILATITAGLDKISFNEMQSVNLTAKFNLKLLTVDENTGTRLKSVQVLDGSNIKIPVFIKDDLTLTDNRIELDGKLTIDKENRFYDGFVRLPLLTATRGDTENSHQTVKLKDITAHITGDKNTLSADGDILLYELPGKFSYRLKHNIRDGSGKLSVLNTDALDLNAPDASLSQLVSPWPYKFDLLSGSIKLNVDADWNTAQVTGKDRFHLASNINIKKVGGYVGKVVFSGLSFKHAFKILPELHSDKLGQLTIEDIDTGVTVSNININLAAKTPAADALPEIIVRNLYGEIFGGSIFANDFIYDLNAKSNELSVNASKIDLALIVETQQLNEIKATGTISGLLPVLIDEKGVFINNGELHNDSNGTIHYEPAAAGGQLQSNPVTGIALDALKDFRYSELVAGVNYVPDGALDIGFRMKGVSPELDTRRPVHLNINTELNLISLLKGLRYAQGISDDIDKKVRKFYEKNK